MVTEHLIGAKLSDETAGSLIYTMPLSEIKRITAFLKFIETEAEKDLPEEKRLLKDWSISHTSKRKKKNRYYLLTFLF